MPRYNLSWVLLILFLTGFVALLPSLSIAETGTLYKYSWYGTVSIPDNGGFDGRVNWSVSLSGAPSNAVVTDVDIEYWINHTYVGDLKVYLSKEEPSGVWHDKYLWDREGGSADDIHEKETGLDNWDGLSPNGTWYLVAADYAAGDVGEIDALKIWVYWETAEPDLTRSTSNINRTTVQPGDTLDVNVTVKNIGNASAGSSSYIYYYWQKDSRSYTDTYKVGSDYFTNLGINDTSDESFTFTIPADSSAETYYFYYWIDAPENVDESDENNNRYYWTITVEDAPPDLIVQSVTDVLASYNVGDKISATATIKNNGAGPAGSTDLKYYLGTTSDHDYRYIEQGTVGALSAEDTDTDIINWPYWTIPSDIPSGTYQVWVQADSSNDEPNESNEGNNWGSSASFTIAGTEPDIRIQPTSLAINQAADSVGDSCGGEFVPVVKGVKSASQGESRLDMIQSDGNRLDVKLTTQGMLVKEKTEDSDTYKVIHLGRYNGELPPGQPNLPAIRKYIYVPKGKSTSLEVTLGDSVDFTNYLVYPTQLPQMDTKGAENPPFYRDEGVYSTDEWLPKEMVYLGPVEIIRGHAIRLLSICPFQYNPAKKILRVFPEINAQMLFSGQKTQIDPRLRSLEFDRFIKGFVLNPGSFDESELGVEAYTGEDYLIITAPEFLTQANALAAHKTGRGISTSVVTTSETGTTSTQIKAYIQNVYDTYSPVPTYVLLLGDVETIPTTYDGTADTGTDLYYSTLDGGNPDPLVADLFLGRISVDTVSEAETVVNKIINYESNPPTLPSFYTNAAVAAYFQDEDDPDYPPEHFRDGYEDRRFVRTSEEVRDFLLGEGYNVDRIYCAESAVTPTNYNNGFFGSGEPLPAELLRANGFAWDGDAADISAAINGGVFLMMHRDHGMDRNYVHPTEGWSFTNTGWGDPYYIETHIAALTNGDLLPIVMSVNCQTGWFDGETDHNPTRNFESFCELFLRKSGGGAVGVFGATRTSYSGYNDFMAEGMIDCVWPNFLPEIPNNSGANARLGPMMNHGKLSMDQLWKDPWGCRQLQYELFHVFGDPSLEMWTSASGGNTFTIYNDGTADLEITSMAKRDGDPWLSWAPTAPLTIPPGGSQVITVSIDWSQVSGSSDDEQIIVYSNDDDMSPYPNAVFVNVTKATVVPAVTTTAVSSITSNSASSGGNVTNDGGAAVTARGVCWSTSANPTTSDSHTSDGTGTGSFTSSITGLSPNTTYHVRAYATNSVGTGYGSDQAFITLANAPGTSSFSNITQTSIRANWTANGNPAGTQYYCENTTAITNSGWITNTYWNSTGLSCGTSYSFRVKARNGDGVETGSTELGSQSTQGCSGDTTPPATSITDGPSGTITYNDVTFTYTGSDNVTSTSNLVYSYKLDGYDSSWSSYTSSTSKSYNDLPDDSYTFYVKAKDEAENVDPSPAFRSFTVVAGRNTKQILSVYSGEHAVHPSCSPDGTKISYGMYSSTGGFEIWVMNSDGSGSPKKIVSDAFPEDWMDDYLLFLSSSWSPDGGKIAYTKGEGTSPSETSDIWTINSDGNGIPLQITTTGFAIMPSWSPDGEKIAYLRLDDDANGQIWVVNSDGTGTPEQITNSGDICVWPSWSPDGKKIAYTSFIGETGKTDLWVGNSDGTGNPSKIVSDVFLPSSIDDHVLCAVTSWSPDGAKICYVSDGGTEGNCGIWVTNSDGSGTPYPITNNVNGAPLGPSWCSDGTKIVYSIYHNPVPGEYFSDLHMTDYLYGDDAFPAANIVSPILNQQISGILDVIGTVTDNISVDGTTILSSLSSWSLEYGEGEEPETWINIVTSSTSKSNELLALWDTSALASGKYTLRLTTTDGINENAQTVTVQIGTGSHSAKAMPWLQLLLLDD